MSLTVSNIVKPVVQQYLGSLGRVYLCLFYLLNDQMALGKANN